MNTFTTQSRPASTIASVSDLDGYSFPPDYSYPPTEDNEFGFDPPSSRLAQKSDAYSPLSLGNWPTFEQEDKARPHSDMTMLSLGFPQPTDQLFGRGAPNAPASQVRYGQITPPRSNSASSEDNSKPGTQDQGDHAGPSTRRRTKSQSKQGQTRQAPPPPASNTPNKKRKTNRKGAPNAVAPTNTSPEDEKRRLSLEKNRLAAAKCRINKKEKTEQLQRDSHDKAVQNAFLKETVFRMKSDIHQMNAILMAHSNCDGCKRPEEIHKHLQRMGADIFVPALDLPLPQYGDFARLQAPDMQDDMFTLPDGDQDPTSLHAPPLPDFNPTSDFDVRTPLPND